MKVNFASVHSIIKITVRRLSTHFRKCEILERIENIFKTNQTAKKKILKTWIIIY